MLTYCFLIVNEFFKKLDKATRKNYVLEKQQQIFG